ncbi:hypothetical protein DAPPUDRAFT_222068 [Daphnia pulex]|uniref:Uncharacterized protein n=1 Tax=Daphnia pulex TaxID=6669 RepID=E9G2R0_DAPPU|nr:hypothetical protein DAPPUDRAFT_222068 [Daphnia pulex]|eukprot:EFX86091.1 hypothetical protein DAPPUDRAFT_222068 [Daphnia pulex]
MRLFLLCLVFLFVSPVLSHFSEEKKDASLDGSLIIETSVINAKNETKLLLPDLQVESADVNVEEISSATSVERRQSRKKKRRNNKRRQNRINQLRKKGKKPNGRKRRPQNDKKGYGKNKRPIFKPIQYLARSSSTDQLNKALDEMLESLSLNLANENSSTFSLKLNNFREDMKISPWAFLAINETETTEVERKIRTERAAGSGTEAVESDATENDEDVDDDETNVEGEAAIEIATESIAEESSTVSEEKEVIATEEENDDDDDYETATEISLNFKQPQKTNATQFYRTQKPSPVVLDDGTIEYNLQLLNENDIKERKLGFNEDMSSEKFQDDTGRPVKKLEGKRGSSRRNSRRPSATVEGIDQIKRKGDVLIGVRENSTTHNVDATLIIGPLHFFMDAKPGFPPQSRVSLPPLSARLRMAEVGGKLVGVRFKPTKIRPDEALLTFKLCQDGKIPTNLETARIVTYLSQEMTKVWNSGNLLRRLKRQFKQLFIDETVGNKREHSKSQDARMLVETLALSAFGAAIKDDIK